jgi:hypothetical protein
MDGDWGLGMGRSSAKIEERRLEIQSIRKLIGNDG